MHLNQVTKPEFVELVYSRTNEFMERINAPQAFIVKEFYDARAILAFRDDAYQIGLSTEPTWNPLYDGCPDYHRLHDNYPRAHVKQKMHAFYYHSWYAHNKAKFDFFSEIFFMKNFLAGYPKGEFMHNVPSDGFVARVNIHHYPKGGGYQTEHIDPVGKHAQIQTLIAASEFGKDYRAGGVFGRATPGGERTYIDPFMMPGDMLVMSPGIHHGVDYIDPELPYDWHSNDGRWMILPLIVGSDYPNPGATKPVEVTTADN